MFRIEWGRDAGPQEGFYEVGGKSLEEIIATIKNGPNIARVTIPEGFSSGQVAQRLGKNGFNGNEIYKIAQPKEGTLFPETYFLRKSLTSDEVIKQLIDEYQTKTKSLTVSDQDLIIASIVEREAKKEDERAKIAAVYLNRLNQNIKLEADPTAQYGRDLALIKTDGLTDMQLWEPLKAGETHSIVSAYNTYLNDGLPPGPICNPGLKSLEAAKNPEKGFDYLYFFHDKDGNVHFSKTYPEHQDLIKQFGL